MFKRLNSADSSSRGQSSARPPLKLRAVAIQRRAKRPVEALVVSIDVSKTDLIRTPRAALRQLLPTVSRNWQEFSLPPAKQNS